jgi:membrane protease YdiL (CAAX protease family)
LIAAIPRRSAAVRACALAALVLLLEWSRALAAQQPGLALASLLLGGVALCAVAFPFSAERLGLGRSKLGLRLLGGCALGAVLLLPAAARSHAVPLIPAGLAAAAVVVSVGEELAFRGVLYAVLEDVGGAPLAIAGTTALWTLAHVLSHPPEFLGAVAAAGLLLGLWRWAARDLVGPIVGHVIADVAL